MPQLLAIFKRVAIGKGFATTSAIETLSVIILFFHLIEPIFYSLVASGAGGQLFVVTFNTNRLLIFIIKLRE